MSEPSRPKFAFPVLNAVPAPRVEVSTEPAEPASPAATGPTLRLEVTGMHCAGCAGRGTAALRSLPGIASAEVQFATETAVVTGRDGGLPAEADVLAALRSAGLTGRVLAAETPAKNFAAATAAWGRVHARRAEEALAWRRRFRTAGILALPVVVLHFFPLLPAGPAVWISAAAALAGQILVGGEFHRRAWEAFRGGSATMDSLVVLGTTAALAGGLTSAFLLPHAGHDARHLMAFMDGLLILTFVSLGRSWEARAKGETTAALAELTSLVPETATRLVAGRPETVPAADLVEGDVILVPPGGKFPADGTVTAGSSAVAQAWLTGEPLPVPKTVGDAVQAGAVNGLAALTLRVERPAGASLLAQLVERVRLAQETKAPIEHFVDRITARFVPAVLAIAATTLLGWGLVAGNWSQGWTSLTAVLVAACPCAMGLAVPTALMAAGGNAARQGIFVQQPGQLQALAETRIVLFDKTGTLTRGQPTVTELFAVEGVTETELLATAAAAEAAVKHPLGEAVLAHARRQGLDFAAATRAEIVGGEGIVAELSTGSAAVGTERLLSDRGAVVSDLAAWEACRDRGETVLGVALGGRYLGWIVVSDPPAAEAAAAVADLHALGLRTEMLTGDHPAAARRIADSVGISVVTARVLPAEKEQVVRARREEFGPSAMVGDGLNDAAALAAADVGIALGEGTALAAASAGLVLNRRDLRLVPRAVRLARRTQKIVRENLAWAFGYNLLLIPAAAGLTLLLFGFSLPPSAAAAAMALSSVSVVLNSLRLRA